MGMYDHLIDRLRNMATALERQPYGRRALYQAADALENQRSEIEGLKQICEKQAGLNQRIVDLMLELDRVKAENIVLLKRLEMAEAERDIVTKHMIELEETLARNSHDVASNEQVTEPLHPNDSGGSEHSLATKNQVKSD